MERDDRLKEIRSLPYLHLFNYKKLGTASMYANFIQAVHENLCFSIPDAVRIFSIGEHHYIRAENCFLKLDEMILKPIEFKNSYGLVDWLFDQSLATSSPNPLLPFEGLSLVVFLSNWCIVDISTPVEHFRQLFCRGESIECERRKADNVPFGAPFIQLQFTIAPPQFDSRIIAKEQIQVAFHDLQQYQLIPSNIRLTSSTFEADGFEITS